MDVPFQIVCDNCGMTISRAEWGASDQLVLSIVDQEDYTLCSIPCLGELTLHIVDEYNRDGSLVHPDDEPEIDTDDDVDDVDVDVDQDAVPAGLTSQQRQQRQILLEKLKVGESENGSRVVRRVK